LSEAGCFNSDWVEKQLAHEEEDDSRRAYDRAEFLDFRIPMMQWWADFLDQLRKGEFVKPRKFKPLRLVEAA
jgi:hypothetical protein